MNHKQRRRKEALQEAKADAAVSKSTVDSSIRTAKKAARLGKITQLADRTPSAAKGGSKKKKASGGAFKADMGDRSRPKAPSAGKKKVVAGGKNRSFVSQPLLDNPSLN